MRARMRGERWASARRPVLVRLG